MDFNLEHYIDNYLEYCIAKGISKNTLSLYRSYLARFRRYAEDISLEEITNELLGGFLKEFNSHKTRIAANSILRGFGSWLEEEEAINPFKDLRCRRNPKAKLIEPKPRKTKELTLKDEVQLLKEGDYITYRQTAIILKISKDSVINSAKRGHLKGKHYKGYGWFFKADYIHFISKLQPEWLLKVRDPNLKELVKEALYILVTERKKFYPRKKVPDGAKAKYIGMQELSEKLGCGYSFVHYKVKPALKKILLARKIEREGRSLTQEIRLIEQMDDLRFSDIIEAKTEEAL